MDDFPKTTSNIDKNYILGGVCEDNICSCIHAHSHHLDLLMVYIIP